jgi:hypothetical protein
MRNSVLLILAMSLCGTTAFAAEGPPDVRSPAAIAIVADLAQPLGIVASPLLPTQSPPVAGPADLASIRARIATADLATARPAKGPSTSFHALAATFVALTLLDSMTTAIALGHGLEEKNPLLGSIASNTPVLVATKGGLALGTVLLTRQLWKTHPTASTILLVAINAVTGLVVASNVRQIQLVR